MYSNDMHNNVMTLASMHVIITNMHEKQLHGTGQQCVHGLAHYVHVPNRQIKQLLYKHQQLSFVNGHSQNGVAARPGPTRGTLRTATETIEEVIFGQEWNIRLPRQQPYCHKHVEACAPLAIILKYCNDGILGLSINLPTL